MSEAECSSIITSFEICCLTSTTSQKIRKKIQDSQSRLVPVARMIVGSVRFSKPWTCCSFLITLGSILIFSVVTELCLCSG